jgi:glutamyl-tRNA reductase
LSKWRAGAITVMNRTEAAADALAQQIGGRPARLDALEDELSQADVVVSAISCDRELLTRDLFARCLRRPRDQRLLVVDAGLPRNAEHADDIDYVGVDDLFVRRNTALDRRTQAVPLVEGHIDDAVRRWQRWCWAQPGETLLRDVFVDEAERRSQLVDELLAAGFPGQREDLDRMVRHAWRPTLRTHARELRSWLHDDHSPTPDVRARGGDSMDFTHGTQP